MPTTLGAREKVTGKFYDRGVQVFNVQHPDFGALGDGVTDDTAAIRLAAVALQATGKGALFFPPGRYRVYTNTADTGLLGDFSNLTGVSVFGDGAEIYIDRVFTGSQTFEVFNFTTCRNVRIFGLKGTCSQIQPVNEKTTRGPLFVKFKQGCIKPFVDLDLTGMWTGVDYYRTTTDSTSFITSHGECHLNVNSCGYGLALHHSGHDLYGSIVGDTCGRTVYMEGVKNTTLKIRSRNHEASDDVLMTSSNGSGYDNIDIDYTNIDSTIADNTLNAINLLIDGITPVEFRNINIHFTIRSTASTYIGHAFHSGKLDAAGVADVTDRGHIVENLRISGTVHGGTANQKSIDVFEVGTWGTGELVSNIHVSGRFYLTNVPVIRLTALQDIAILDNLFASASSIDIRGNTTGRIVCIGCVGDNLTTGTGDTARVDYIGCNILSGATQAKQNKTFLATRIAGIEQFRALPTISTASLPAGSASMNGTVLLEDAGATVNLVIYANDLRFRIDGGAAF